MLILIVNFLSLRKYNHIKLMGMIAMKFTLHNRPKYRLDFLFKNG